MSRIVRKNEVCELTGLSRSTIYDLISKGHFPKQVRLGVRSVGWILEEVQSWIASRPTVGRPSEAQMKPIPKLLKENSSEIIRK